MRRAEAKKPKSCIVSLRMDEDDFSRLDALARQTSCSRAEVLRRNVWFEHRFAKCSPWAKRHVYRYESEPR